MLYCEGIERAKSDKTEARVSASIPWAISKSLHIIAYQTTENKPGPAKDQAGSMLFLKGGTPLGLAPGEIFRVPFSKSTLQTRKVLPCLTP